MRGVGQFQHSFAHDVGGGFRPEHARISGGRDERELFDDIPVEVCALRFLARHIVEHQRVEVGE